MLYRIVGSLWLVLGVVMVEAQQNQSADSIVGLWQRGSAGIADGLLDSYRFYPDGRFTFAFSTLSNSGKRIIGVEGRYRISQDTIRFTPIATIEFVGGRIRKGGPPLGVEWELEGQRIDTLKVKSPVGDKVHFEISRTGKQSILRMDTDPYWLISHDPDVHP